MINVPRYTDWFRFDFIPRVLWILTVNHDTNFGLWHWMHCTCIWCQNKSFWPQTAIVESTCSWSLIKTESPEFFIFIRVYQKYFCFLLFQREPLECPSICFQACYTLLVAGFFHIYIYIYIYQEKDECSHQRSGRLRFNPRSSHAKVSKNNTWSLFA